MGKLIAHFRIVGGGHEVIYGADSVQAALLGPVTCLEKALDGEKDGTCLYECTATPYYQLYCFIEMQEKVDEARFLLNNLSYEVFSFSMSLRPYVLNEVVVYHAVEQWMDRLFVSAEITIDCHS